MPWNGSWNEHWSHPVRCVRSGRIPGTLVQVECAARPSSALLTLIDPLSVVLVSVRMLVRGRRPPGYCYCCSPFEGQ